ncbi:MAG: hypothetical protein KIT80_22735 [Chitinophagaceae bacterium]|nr:hypothetical protein [Chitinophagaceae bacterium]MCW5929754.1 hypothetical protein [Chitinophagaceae bacterium]
MERNIYTDDALEDFLKEKSDQYKLYPSDKVWNNIQRSIQPKSRWNFLVLTLLMLTISTKLVEYEDIYTFNHSDYQQNTPVTNNTVAAALPSLPKAVMPALPVAYSFNEGETIIKPRPAVVTINEQPLASLSDTRMIIEDNIPGGEIIVPDKETPDLHITPPNISELGLIVKNVKNTTKLVTVNEEEKDTKTEVRKMLWGGEPFKPSRLKWHVSFSPTISYRRLTSGLENITEIFRGVPYETEASVGTVNNSVIQKPAVGAEVGAGFSYKLNNRLVVKGGLQLNYSRYQVKAMFGKPEQATLAVGPYSDSLKVYTTIQNIDGKAASWLNNEYFQIAMPVGVEWTILGNSNFKWNLAASAQPVYNFANNVYLLSTDFRHYAKDPSLIRKWNINAGVETFVSYKMGAFNWHAGPQFRYQLASSYKRQYPINEYMVDFGFKIGVTKTIF